MGLITIQPERTNKRTETHGVCLDAISRQQAIDAISEGVRDDAFLLVALIKSKINKVPPAQPEIKPIEYSDCANAMLRMWMDNVVTDGEYKRIMDKLNAHWEMEVEHERHNIPR